MVVESGGVLDGDDAGDDAWLGEGVVDFDKVFFVGGFVWWKHGEPRGS